MDQGNEETASKRKYTNILNMGGILISLLFNGWIYQIHKNLLKQILISAGKSKLEECMI